MSGLPGLMVDLGLSEGDQRVQAMPDERLISSEELEQLLGWWRETATGSDGLFLFCPHGLHRRAPCEECAVATAVDPRTISDDPSAVISRAWRKRRLREPLTAVENETLREYNAAAKRRSLAARSRRRAVR